MNERERRRVEQLRADERAVPAAAEWVRGAADGDLAALSLPHVAAGCGQLLDVLAEGLEGLPEPVRVHTVRVSRELTGDPMDRPTVRRTRRR
ncbi:MAG: hypothetical protein L0I76_35040 [Pseudonocardia sp.]|nr:hypothetical protein [Pseudonocardia sp.]